MTNPRDAKTFEPDERTLRAYPFMVS